MFVSGATLLWTHYSVTRLLLRRTIFHELPNQFSVLVNQVMVQETKHWREQSSLEM